MDCEGSETLDGLTCSGGHDTVDRIMFWLAMRRHATRAGDNNVISQMGDGWK